jgi:hypothetical protein
VEDLYAPHCIFDFVLYFSCLNGCVGWQLCSKLWACNGLLLNTYISVYARTNRCYKERGSRTNYVRSSIPHCIYDTMNCIISRSNALVNNKIELLQTNKAVNCLHVCNFKSTNTKLYCQSAGRQSMMSPHDIHKQLFSETSSTTVEPKSILSSGGSSSTG